MRRASAARDSVTASGTGSPSSSPSAVQCLRALVGGREGGSQGVTGGTVSTPDPPKHHRHAGHTNTPMQMHHRETHGKYTGSVGHRNTTHTHAICKLSAQPSPQSHAASAMETTLCALRRSGQSRARSRTADDVAPRLRPRVSVRVGEPDVLGEGKGEGDSDDPGEGDMSCRMRTASGAGLCRHSRSRLL